MEFGTNVGYTRWYDRIPALSQAVRMMEKLPEARQRWISETIVNLMPMHQVPQRTDGLKKVGSEKVLGLMKSKVKRRWYDQDPMVHQAFNYLYLMTDELRYEMAIKIMICIKAMDVLMVSSNNPTIAYGLIHTIFNKPLSYLQQHTHIENTLGNQPKRLNFSFELELGFAPEMDLPLLSPEPKVMNGIEVTGQDGLKLTRIKPG